MMNQLIRTTTKKYIKNISKQIANKPRYFASAEVGERPEPNVCDSLLQIGSRRIYSQEHDMYREMLRNFYDEKVVPFHEEWEDKGEVPRELWTDAGANSMLGVTMPEEYGGLGVDILYSSVNWQEQSYAGTTGPGWALHSEIVCPYILNYGTDEQKQEYLPKLCSGEYISAIAMTEPGAGSDLQGMKTTAIKDGDDYILNGSKVFITNGWLADLVIVCAKTDPTKGAKGISLFLVEAGTPGFTKGKKLKKMGMKAQDTAELFFEDVRLPKSALLGKEGAGFMYLMEELPQERLLIADMGVAAAEACYEWTRDYVKQRKAFGKTLSNLQTIQHKLAEMKTDIVVGRTFADHCLELHAAGKLDNGMASMAKYWLTDLQNKVADDCVQLHGGWGYMWEYPVCRAYVDGRVQSIYGGSNEIMKELIARSI
jgi:long-chain-acyl-CoA dehydrogenase